MQQDSSTHLEPGRRNEETPVADRDVGAEENKHRHGRRDLVT
jgi:hypothetical protein